MSTPAANEVIRIDAQHPALPGHFPGNPVVPGVVLLDRVAAAIENRLGRSVVGLPQVKFVRPLLPEQAAELALQPEADAVRFTLARDGATLATGSVETRAR